MSASLLTLSLSGKNKNKRCLEKKNLLLNMCTMETNLLLNITNYMNYEDVKKEPTMMG